MGRAPCCTKVGLHRGPWTAIEDALLTDYIKLHGKGNWRSMPKKAGLLRCGKSCRLRWMNYLRPDIKRGNITSDEDDLIMKMHSLLGNRWSLIAGRLPGRTDNEIKNYWNTHLSKKLTGQGTDPNTNKRQSDPSKKKEPRKRRNHESNNGNKRQNRLSTIPAPEPEKIKAHNPKPIRINSFSSFSLSRDSSFYWTNTDTASGSSTLEGETGLFTWYNQMKKVMAGVAPEGGSIYDDKMNELLTSNGQDFFASEDEVYEIDAMSLQENLLRVIYAYGFKKPSAIQQRGVAPLTVKSVIQRFRSKTGKTTTSCPIIIDFGIHRQN